MTNWPGSGEFRAPMTRKGAFSQDRAGRVTDFCAAGGRSTAASS